MLTQTVNVGKTAIFKKQHAWEHPLGQSDRDFANLLSTLRTFTDITSGRNMEEDQQDATLRILHLMMRFPPAVRAAYILMRGETPRPSECAALSQALYETLKEVVPLAIVSNDPLRFFEGTCLLFGLILGKAKKLRVNPSNNSAVNDLPSADPWVLTLDRSGFLAVYVGREGYGGVAGRDILMFRPLSGEEAVDVSVITQLLVPILARRNADGTSIFEAYGSQYRQIKEPDEAVVVCVGLSMSMDERCGFADIEASEDADAFVNRNVQTAAQSPANPVVEHPGGECLALDELKGTRSCPIPARWSRCCQS